MARRPTAAILAAALALTGCAAAGSDDEIPWSSPRPGGGDPVTRIEGAALGVKWEWHRLDRYQASLARLPGGGTFYEMSWCDTEPTPGARDWSRIDHVVAGAKRLGIETALKLRVGTCWATDKRLPARGNRGLTPSLPPRDAAAYVDFVRATVSRYAPLGVHRWAIENEVNGGGFWAAGPGDYLALARLVAPAIREADPGAIVFDSGLSSTAYGAALARWLLDTGRPDDAVDAYRRYYQRRFAVRGEQLPRVSNAAELEAVLAEGQPARNLEYFDASVRLAREGTIDAWQLHFYERFDNVALVADLLAAHLPDGMPVEAWEAGLFWPDAPDDEAVLADETTRVVAALLAAGVRRVYWLPATANPAAHRRGEIRFGIFAPDGRPRKSAEVFLTLAHAALDAAVYPLPSRQVGGVALEREGRTVMVLWSNGEGLVTGPPPAPVPGAAPASAARPGGEAVAWGPEGIPLGPEPVILDVPGPAPEALALVP